MARVRDKHDERGERQHPEIEVELRDVQYEPADRRPDVITAAAHCRVVAEHVRRRTAAHSLDSDHEHRAKRDEPVQRLERGERTRAPPLDPRQHERRREHGDDERDRLRTCFERNDAQREHDDLSPQRRALEHAHEGEREPEEDRIERVLGHQRPGVRKRRQRNSERRSRERRRPADDAAREQVRREDRGRHRQRVDRARPPVHLGHRPEQRVRGRDQQRVDEAVVAVRAPDQEVARRGEAARHVRVDELVDHDPRRAQPQPQRELNGDRREIESDQPGPCRQCPHEPWPGV